MRSGEKAASAIPEAARGDVCRNILARLDTALSVRDKDFNPLYANAAYLHLFDTTLDVWMRERWSAHFGPKSAPFVQNEIIPIVMAGSRWKGELEIQTPDGQCKQVIAELNSVRDDNGEITNFYALYSEVTRLQTSRIELERHNQFLDNIIDAMPDPLIVKDADHTWIAVNNAFCKLTGRSREELLGKSDYDYFPKEEADVFWRQDDEAMRTGKEIANEEAITVKNGETRILSTKKVAIEQPDGTKLLLGMARDITAERQLERAIAKSYRQLEVNLTALKRDLSGLQENVASGVSRAEAIRGLIAHSNRGFTDYVKEAGSASTPVNSVKNTPSHLSSREYQVFMLLAKGYRVKDAADHLGITSNTVSTYRSRIMKKLEFSSLTELVQYALQYGLI